MNDQERQELVDRLGAISRPVVTLRHTLKWLAVWLGLLVVCAAIAVALFARMDVLPAVVIGLIMGFVAVVMIVCLYAMIVLLSGYLHWSAVQSGRRRGEVPQIREALDRGMVSVKRVTASSVAVIEEYEDEGRGFTYDIGEGRLLFLKGQDYAPVSEAMAWPNSRFEIVRSEDGVLWIGIFCFGEQLVPEVVIPSSACREEFVYAVHEELVTDELHAFCRRLTRGS